MFNLAYTIHRQIIQRAPMTSLFFILQSVSFTDYSGRERNAIIPFFDVLISREASQWTQDYMQSRNYLHSLYFKNRCTRSS